VSGMDYLQAALTERRAAAELMQQCADGLVQAAATLRTVAACCGPAAEMGEALAAMQASRVAMAAVAGRYQAADAEVCRWMGKMMVKTADCQTASLPDARQEGERRAGV
jgi:hypothetical protein